MYKMYKNKCTLSELANTLALSKSLRTFTHDRLGDHVRQRSALQVLHDHPQLVIDQITVEVVHQVRVSVQDEWRALIN